jgi:hypothetical protein
MLRIIDTTTNDVIPIDQALSLGEDGYESIDDMMSRLLAAQRAGLIRIEPDGDALQRMAVRAGLQAYTARARTEDGIRQFAPDRRGGRINRTARRIAELDDVNRREAIRSIQRFMNMEGPAAYRSQAQLLAALDPTIDGELVARQAAEAVGDAVRGGITEGRRSVQVNEQAS